MLKGPKITVCAVKNLINQKSSFMSRNIIFPHEMDQTFFTADILIFHSKKSKGALNYINNGLDLFNHKLYQFMTNTYTNLTSVPTLTIPSTPEMRFCLVRTRLLFS